MGGYLMSLELNRRHFLGGSLLIGGALATPTWAKKATRGISSSWTQIQAMLDATIAKKYVPGVGAAIARGTDQADFLTAGSLAFGDTTAITPDSLWRAYSMTKPITGIAVMMLIEDGKLRLDQNVADIIPAFANPKVLTDPAKGLDSRASTTPVTIRALLTHTAGIGYDIISTGPLLDAYKKLGLRSGMISRRELPGFPKPEYAPSLEEFANRLGSLPLIADPGVKWSYSAGIDLLGRVIEVVSGMTFDAFLKKRIFDPLGMTSSFFQVAPADVKRFTTNHFALPTGPFPIDPGNDSIFSDKPPLIFGGSGLVSSMRDYDRFLAMLMGEGALGQTQIMGKLAANNAMSNLVGPDTIMESFVTGQGFGAGGRVTIKSGPNGEGVGTYGWGGAASTIGWVDRSRKIRASGWSQIMTQGTQPFTTEFGKTVYASL
jgi:CubicO group peptidase (beta-lactamase class C family)